MKKFKVGDRVRRIQGHGSYEPDIGKVYRVTNVYSNGTIDGEAVDVPGSRTDGLTVSNFVLVDEAAPQAPKPSTPLDTQVGGGHYNSKAIQPVQYAHANGLDFFQGTVVKYITRFREKNGKQDLEKAKHIIELLIALEYPETNA